jgi:Carboxypeptidase regulatory-like domain
MSGSIEGKVINQRDGLPIAGAKLECTGEGVEMKAESAENGDFRIESLKEGHYELTAHKAGFEAGIYGPLVVMSNEPTKLMLGLQPKGV